MRTFCSRLVLSLFSLTVTFSCLASAGKNVGPTNQPQQQTAKQADSQQKPQQAAVETPSETDDIVARIGQYVITKEQLETRLMEELRPVPEEERIVDEPVDAKTVLEKMIAEKAMIIEGRKQGYPQDQEISSIVDRYRRGRLVNLLLAVRLHEKVTVTGAEIEQKLKEDPKLGPARAKQLIQRERAKPVLDQYYSDLLEKLRVKKLSENFPKAAEIHQRLLYKPKKARSESWITNGQVRSELTEDEKGIVLATYDGGKFILKDWFEALCDIAPPSRPRDLNTPKGVEQLLDRALRMPILVTEAMSRGLDKDEELVREVREAEDRQVLYKVQSEKLKDMKDPNDQQIIAYFEKNRAAFGSNPTLKIDQIWCQDLKSARAVKGELDKGGDFQSLKQKESLYKDAAPLNVYPGGEGVFWKDLWKTEPNQIAGPLKGFCPDGIRWRIVKVLEKKPGQVKEYSAEVKQRVRSRMLSEQRVAILAKFGKELLEKHRYELYADSIKEIDPLNTP